MICATKGENREKNDLSLKEVNNIRRCIKKGSRKLDRRTV